jgi:hypothetical protein
MFDVCTTGKTAPNDTIFKFLPHRGNMGAAIFFRPLGTDHCSSEEYRCTHVDAVWLELEYSIDVCLVTRGAHIEHIQLSTKILFFCGCEQFN